jgi:Putative bacterial sensory transduction regulator
LTDSGLNDSGLNDSGPNDSGPNDSGPKVSSPNDSGPEVSGPEVSGPEESAAVQEAVRQFLDESGITWELGRRAGELIVTLPGEKRLTTLCSLVVGEQSLSISAFVVRNPDENHESVYAYLLRRNLRLPGLAYGIDKSGDVYLTGRVPLQGVSAAYLDQILGVVLDASDGAFNELLALGFLESMKKEWAWRNLRGESTRNLEAFRHLLETPPEGPMPSL